MNGQKIVDDLERDIQELATRLAGLKDAVKHRSVGGTALSAASRPACLDQTQARSWVNPHQPIAWPDWPPGVWPKLSAVIKKIVRRLLSWYVNPLVEQQNAFNAAAAQTLEMLYQQVATLRLQLDLAGQAASGKPAAAEPALAQSPVYDGRRPLPRRLRLAFFTPLTPLKTAIADHSEGLLPAMAERADIDLYIDDGYTPTNPHIVEQFGVYSHAKFAEQAGLYDAILYAMGDNASFHRYIYRALQRYPGIVILHDTTLHRFMIGSTLEHGDVLSYLDEMEYAYGLRDVRIGQQVLAGYGEAFVTRYPFIERVIDSAQGIIVHNRHARDQVLERRPTARVACIGQHFFLPPGFPEDVNPVAVRAEMGLTGRFIVASFGIFVPDKRLDSCLGAFARFARQHPEAVYLFAGSYQDYDLPGRAQALGVEDQVLITGWLDPIRFTKLMYIADVGVHLRYPHIGGTPFSPVRMMGLGIPTIVSDIEPFTGFPEGSCIKVAADEHEEETLLACLSLLAGEPDLRRRIGETGRRFLQTYHNARDIAGQYLAFIERTAATGEQL